MPVEKAEIPSWEQASSRYLKILLILRFFRIVSTESSDFRETQNSVFKILKNELPCLSEEAKTVTSFKPLPLLPPTE